jgi:uncharacterized protein
MNKPLPSAAATGAGAPTPEKPWAVTPAKVEVALERIVAAVHPLRILAFGSRASGDAALESDLDLLVVLPKSSPEAEASSVIQGALQGLLLCIDVLVIEEGRFERLRGALNSLYREVDREGVELYADGSARRDAVAKVSR